MACRRLSRHFFIKDDNFTVSSIQKTFQGSSNIWSGKGRPVEQHPLTRT